MINNPLLKAAGVDLRYAKFGCESGDDGLTGVAGFHIQQAVEKILKASLAANGVEYKKTHDIGSLLQMVSKIPQWIPEDLWNKLEMAAPLLTSWENRPRYGEFGPYLITFRTVVSQFKMAAELYVLAVDKFDTQSLDNKAPVPTLELLKLQ